MELSYKSDVGLVRPNNEDSLLVVPPWREPAISRQICVMGVADGMGGHSSGEVASRLAVDTLRNWLKRLETRELTLGMVETAFCEANQAIWKHASDHEETRGMGTTLTAAFLLGKQVLIGHVGDSRAYLYRNNDLRQLTRDHTLVAEQIRLGNITAEQAKKHPARHILSRAMGVREFVNVDTTLMDLVPNDVFIVCSDGIYGQITEEMLREKLAEKPFGQIAKNLVAEANKAGGLDNSTVVLCKVDELPLYFPPHFSLGRMKGLINDWFSGF